MRSIQRWAYKQESILYLTWSSMYTSLLFPASAQYPIYQFPLKRGCWRSLFAAWRFGLSAMLCYVSCWQPVLHEDDTPRGTNVAASLAFTFADLVLISIVIRNTHVLGKPISKTLAPLLHLCRHEVHHHSEEKQTFFPEKWWLEDCIPLKIVLILELSKNLLCNLL